MECVTETNIFAFGIALMKIIASLEKRFDKIIKDENVIGCI